MKNIEKFLKQVMKLQEIVADRAYELLIAQGITIKLHSWPYKIEYEDDGVYCVFSEDTHSDCSDTACIDLKIEHLEKTDEEWKKYIGTISEKTLKEKEAKEKQLQKELLERKYAELERLKKELDQ